MAAGIIHSTNNVSLFGQNDIEHLNDWGGRFFSCYSILYNCANFNYFTLCDKIVQIKSMERLIVCYCESLEIYFFIIYIRILIIECLINDEFQNEKFQNFTQTINFEFSITVNRFFHTISHEVWYKNEWKEWKIETTKLRERRICFFPIPFV